MKRLLGLLIVAITATPCLAGDLDRLNAIADGASCLIQANSVTKLAAPSAGMLSKILVQRGDLVRAGQRIAELDSSVEQAAYEVARQKAESIVMSGAKRAQLTNAQQKLARSTQLAQHNFTPQATLEDAQTAAALAEFDLAQALLDQSLAKADALRLKAELGRRIIVSPVDGVVTRVDMHAGEYADPTNSTVAVIAEIKLLRVEAYLPLEGYPLISQGMRATVETEGLSMPSREALVTMKDPLIDAASGLFQIVLLVKNDDGLIPAGLHCKLHFLP